MVNLDLVEIALDNDDISGDLVCGFEHRVFKNKFTLLTNHEYMSSGESNRRLFAKLLLQFKL